MKKIHNFDDLKTLATPAFPLEVVRNIAIAGLEQAFNVNQVHNRDPIGGSNEDLFVPLFKLLDNLLQHLVHENTYFLTLTLMLDVLLMPKI